MDLVIAGKQAHRLNAAGNGGGGGIESREQFVAALAEVNAWARDVEISVSNAKEAYRKAEALKAWAAFDRRLTDDERKEANRCMTRVVKMLAEVSEREQPRIMKGKKRGGTPGPLAWLMRELKITASTAARMRTLVLSPEIYRTAIEEGIHWFSASCFGSQKRARVKVLTTCNQWMRVTNSARFALGVHPNNLRAILLLLRKIKAWCEAAEATIIQRIAREGKAEK